MNMFNLIFGDGSRGLPLLAALGFEKTTDVGRYRDAWIEKTDDGEFRIAVYTRNGGGNRSCWKDGTVEDCTCVGCTQEKILPQHELYISDQDDSYDSTYATTYFKLPEDLVPIVKDIDNVESVQGPVDMAEKWQGAIKTLDPDDPKFDPLKEALTKAFNGEGPGIIEV